MPGLPKFISKYFWGDNLNDLQFSKHKQYISRTLLDRGDVRAVKWLTSKVPQKQLKTNLSRKLSPKSYNFWRLFF